MQTINPTNRTMPIELFTAKPHHLNSKYSQLLFPETKKDLHNCVKGRFVVKSSLSHPTNRIPMAKKKDKVKKRKLALEPGAAVYAEDIGTQGIKTSSITTPTGYSKSISELPLPNDEEERRQKRMERFGIVSKEIPKHVSASVDNEGLEISKTTKKRKSSSQNKFIGASTALEKPYLRLTDFPKAENVRPLAVLRKALVHVKSHYIQHEDFEWANEQLKSIRQDVTVQHIRNKFVLDVYETHARLLVEHGELDEFHQCQCMIQSLTSPTSKLDPSAQPEEDSEGTDKFRYYHDDNNQEGEEQQACLRQSEEAEDEFYAYGLLYNLVQNSWGELTRLLSIHQRGTSDRLSSDGSMTGSSSCDSGEIPACFRGIAVRHALKVIKAVMNDDYQSFFRLYESAPHLSAYLMDFLVRRVRKNAYHRIIVSYRPSVSVEHFREALSFQDLEETRRFLKENGAIFIHELGAPPFWVDCKATCNATPRAL